MKGFDLDMEDLLGLLLVFIAFFIFFKLYRQNV